MGRTEWVGEWSEGLCLHILHRDHFHWPMQCYTWAVQCAKGIPEFSRKARIVSRVNAKVSRKQGRRKPLWCTTPSWACDSSGSYKAASTSLCNIRCPLPTDLPHEVEMRAQTLLFSDSLLWPPWDAVNLLNRGFGHVCLQLFSSEALPQDSVSIANSHFTICILPAGRQRHLKLAAFITNARSGWKRAGWILRHRGYAIPPSTLGEPHCFTTAEDPLGGIYSGEGLVMIWSKAASAEAEFKRLKDGNTVLLGHALLLLRRWLESPAQPVTQQCCCR